jgi:hypothetical protein
LQSAQVFGVVILGAGEATDRPEFLRVHPRQEDASSAVAGLVVLGLSIDDDQPRVVRRVADHMGVKFRLAMADERVLGLYGPIRSIPTTVFIDRRGEVVRRVVGYIDPETMEAYLLDLLD